MKTSIKEIWEFLQTGWDVNDPNSQINYLSVAAQYYAYLHELRIEHEAKLRKQNYEFKYSEASQGLKQFEYKNALEGFTNEEMKALSEIDSLLKVISKQQEALITTISYYKTENNLQRLHS